MEILVAFPATTVSHNLLKRLFDEHSRERKSSPTGQEGDKGRQYPEF